MIGGGNTGQELAKVTAFDEGGLQKEPWYHDYKPSLKLSLTVTLHGVVVATLSFAP